MKHLRITIAVLLATSSGAMAQVPPDIAEKTRALGQTMNPVEGYSPWQGRIDPAMFDGVTITRGIAYGSEPSQELDIYMADGTERAKRPVMVFVHGGGFVGGRRGGQPYPDNIPTWAVHEGMVGVSVDYRLAPANKWPAAANDLASALLWVRGHIGEYGGDPDRIVVFGHSAGANHVADYVAHPEVQGTEIAGIKGAVLLSPFYADEVEPGAAPHPYYGTDANLQTAHPQVERLRGANVPLFLGNAEFDPYMMQHFAEQARDWLCEQPEACPEYVRLGDHNHFTEGMALGTEDKSLSGPLVAWMKRNGVL